MKQIASLSLFAVILAAAFVALRPARAADDKSPAQAKHRVLFEVTTDGVEQWTATLANVENLRKAFGPETTQVEVVGHSKGLGMMLAKNATLADRMKKLADAGVVFAACQNSMRKYNVTKTDLLPFAITVDSGVAEVVRKQEAGWSYTKTDLLPFVTTVDSGVAEVVRKQEAGWSYIKSGI